MKYFELEPLPYSDHALEPVIGRETLTSLYTDVYSHSVSQLNQLVEDYPDLRFGHIDCLLGGLSHVPQEIRQDIQRYGGAYKNVTLFLHTLTSPNTNTINGPIKDAINRSFESLEKFQQQFTEVAHTHVGNGWTWLMLNPDNTLAITSTKEQINPIMNMQTAILGINLWDYMYVHSSREEYINNFFTIINWKIVNHIYEETLKNPNRFGHE